MRVRSKRAAEAVGLGAVEASLARPRHTWETGKGDEKEQQWLKRAAVAEEAAGSGSGMRQWWGRRWLGESHAGGAWRQTGQEDRVGVGSSRKVETLGQSHVDGEHGRGWRQQGKCEGTTKGKQMETAEALSSLYATSICPLLYGSEGQSEQIMHSFRISTTLPLSPPRLPPQLV